METNKIKGNMTVVSKNFDGYYCQETSIFLQQREFNYIAKAS